MYFKRKAYNRLIEWKEKYADRYAVILEGARRVGKSTIAKQFAENEYRSYIIIDFSTLNIKAFFTGQMEYFSLIYIFFVILFNFHVGS